MNRHQSEYNANLTPRPLFASSSATTTELRFTARRQLVRDVVGPSYKLSIGYSPRMVNVRVFSAMVSSILVTVREETHLYPVNTKGHTDAR